MYKNSTMTEQQLDILDIKEFAHFVQLNIMIFIKMSLNAHLVARLYKLLILISQKEVEEQVLLQIQHKTSKKTTNLRI